MTPCSQLAIRYALSLVREEHSHLTVLRIVPGYAGRVNPARWHAGARHRLKQLIPSESKTWCEPEFVVEEGDAEEIILNHARMELPDLIVLALPRTRDFNTLDAAVTYKIITSSPSAVLAVPDRFALLPSQLISTLTVKQVEPGCGGAMQTALQGESPSLKG